VRGLREILLVKCDEARIRADIRVGGYGQVAQETLDPASELYAFGPTLMIVFQDLADLAGASAGAANAGSDDDRRAWADEALASLTALADAATKHSAATVLVHNLRVPTYSPLGILENKRAFGMVEAVRSVNDRLRDLYKTDPRVFVFDFDTFCSRVGKDDLADPRMEYLADARLRWEHLPQLCDEYLAYILPMAGRSRKCVVLDLDNTLWGGIVGEDGLDGLRVGPAGDGRPFWDFQQHLKALARRGVVLAICSRNNPEDALAVLRQHPGMVLREDDFAAMRVNWQDKPGNLIELSHELQLGLDAFVFVDDDKANGQVVQEALPEVLVVDLPDDPALYVSTLRQLRVFDTLQLTQEDADRARLYTEQRRREDAARSVGDVEAYLASLGTVITIERVSEATVARTAQLTQKTNQFNLTTRRYSEAAIREFAGNPGMLAACARVTDKFGDNGITGVLIVETNGPAWRIDTFLLSCRVIGRRVEHAVLSYLVAEACRQGARALVGEFIPTPKNAPAAGFFRDAGFTLTSRESGREFWTYDTARPFVAPDCVTLVQPQEA
jgi:FkbH-like protein